MDDKLLTHLKKSYMNLESGFNMISTVYHVTDRDYLDDILENGLLGGWGDDGFGIYVFTDIYDAEEYAKNMGWDGGLQKPVILQLQVKSEYLDTIDVHPEWPDPEKYENIRLIRLDDDDEDEYFTPHNIEVIKENIQSQTLTLWHGGNLDDMRNDYISHKKGRWEYGPGLYMTTHWGTANQYAKGSRKLYKITIEKGTDLDEKNIPQEKVYDFIDTWVIKKLRNEVKDRLERYTQNGMVNSDVFLNIMINEGAVKNTNTNQLRQFFVENGIDYKIVSNAFGWGETMVVLYNMKKIVHTERMTGNYKAEDLPTEFS